MFRHFAMQICFAATWIVTQCVFPWSVEGAILRVPEEYPTISQAISATSTNDTVLVGPGEYAERLIFPAYDIVVASHFLLNRDTTTIVATIVNAQNFAQEDVASVLSFLGGNTRATLVSGFTLTGGHGMRVGNTENRLGGGLYIVESHPVIEWCHITSCESSHNCAAYINQSLSVISHCDFYLNCGVNGLIEIGGNLALGYAVLEWNDIYLNTFCGSGYPLLQYNGVTCHTASATIRYNRFRDAEGWGHAGIKLTRCHADIYGNTFENIRVNLDGNIIESDFYSNPITANSFRDCFFEHGVCIALLHQGNPNNHFRSAIHNNWFERITGDLFPSGIFMQFPNAEIVGNVFMQCSAQGPALGLSHFSGQGCDVVLERNYFGMNQHVGPLLGGTAFQSQGISPACELRNNWFEGNSGLSVDYQLESNDTSVYDATLNYWGHPTGPYHPTENPNGQGDTVDVNIHVTPWLTEPPDLDVDVRERLKLNPEDWTLEQVYPNPFNGQTNIRIIATKPQPMSVSVYNTLGQKISNIWQGVVAKDEPTLIRWDGVDNFNRHVASGVYYIVAQPRGSSGGVPKAQKAVLIR